MKSSRYRPPLNLSDPDPDNTPKVEPAVDAEIAYEPSPRPSPDRPMSERQRRKLAEREREETEAQARISVAHPPALAPEPAPPAVEAPALAISRTRAPKPDNRAYVIAGLAAALWVAGVAALAYVESAGVTPDGLTLAVYALLALAPAGLAVLLAHALRQGQGLAAETKRARDLSEALLAPTALAAQRTGEVLRSLRDDIDHAALAADRARNDMVLLRQALADETQRLNEAADTAGRTARRLTEQLAGEREQMLSLGGRLDVQATNVIDSIERQSRMVVDASDLAQTQLREAEAALAARAADMAAAATEAQDAARLAADDLSRQTLRLENAGSGVSEQIQAVEEGLGQQRAALVTAAYALRTDQEDFSAQVESQRAQLTEQLSATRSVSAELGEVSARAGDSLRDVVEAATDQFRALVEMSQREADSFDAATKVALDRFEALAAEGRDVLVEETRRALAAMQATADDSRTAADAAALEAQKRADRLGEAVFEASRKADQAADTHIENARRLVGDTSQLVDEAGQRAVERLEAMLERLTGALGQIDESLDALDQRSERLPGEAQKRIESVRASVEEGLAALTAASQKAASDTEALDAGFQERVRRNYDMLTETVRLMGVVSGDGTAPRRRVEPEPVRREAIEPPGTTRRREASVTDGNGFGLRNRLKLAVAPTDSPPMNWSDLEDDAAETPLELDTPVTSTADSAALAERVLASIRRMGVDPNALLPRSRVEEAAQAVAAGDRAAARAIVRRVAPAAVRSVSRRVLTDADLRADAEAYVRAFGRELAELAVVKDGPGVTGRLTSDGGRAWMLLDAAVGDLS